MAFIAALLAFIVFLLATFGVKPSDDISMIPLGLTFLALAVMLGYWPARWIGRDA
jgi:hypothetical protein